MVTSHGPLIAVAAWMRCHKIWPIIAENIVLPQKTVCYTPQQKLLAILVTILTGAHGLVEANTRLAPDEPLWQAFGLPGCPDQSTLNRTLAACTAETVASMRACLTTIYRQHGQALRHSVAEGYLTLDIDLTGLPCGAQAEGATKGYFADERGRRGRQVGRVGAAAAAELVTQALYPGKQQLSSAFCDLVTQAEAVLRLSDAPQRRSTILLRVDGGGGTEAEINWALGRDYQLLTKLKNHQRTQKLAQSVSQWYADPTVSGRQVGLVERPYAFAKPTLQVAVRWPASERKKKETVRIVVTSLPADAIARLMGQATQPPPSLEQMVVAVAHAYDQRGGGIETQNREDKQGLGLDKRNSQKLHAQEMLMLLAELAHNILVWVRQEMAAVSPDWQRWGLLRLVRDALQITAVVVPIPCSQRRIVLLNQRHPLSRPLLEPLRAIGGSDLVVNLRKI